MEDTVATTAGKTSRFELAPPRHFILPAILLLLSERPGYGYSLVPRLQEFRFGHVDRPAVYRALAQLERDGLVEASSQSLTTGQARRVYRLTPRGEPVLRAWMGVIKEEHDYLGQVLRRYQATGTTEAVLAEVEGSWASVLGCGWSPVSSTSSPRRRLVPLDSDGDRSSPPLPRGPAASGAEPTGGHGGGGGGGGARNVEVKRYRLVAARSVVLIEARSTVGPLSFGTIGVTGVVQAAVLDGGLCTEVPYSGSLEIDVSGLSSGNRLYDAELLRRIDARRFPSATVELCECTPSGPGSRYRLKGKVTFHGVTRPAQGTVSVEVISDHRLVVTGEQSFDIRDFAIPSPTMLMLRIYPDVRVRFHAEAELEERP